MDTLARIFRGPMHVQEMPRTIYYQINKFCYVITMHINFSSLRLYFILKRPLIAWSRSYSLSEKFSERQNFPDASNFIIFPQQTFLCGTTRPPPPFRLSVTSLFLSTVSLPSLAIMISVSASLLWKTIEEVSKLKEVADRCLKQLPLFIFMILFPYTKAKKC